jgi:hypothetical protein
MVAFVRDELPRRARGRACFLLTQDYTGQTIWADRLAALAGVPHLNVLRHFGANPDLASRTSTFTVRDLFQLATAESKSQPVLIVSGFEFLRAAWSGQSLNLEALASEVELWNRRPALLLVTQHDPAIANRPYTRYPTQRTVIDQSKTVSLS